jgi:CheY-like chemotaxis protein
VAIRKLKTNKYDLLITDNLFPMGSHLPFPLNFQDSGIKLIRLIREGKLSNKEEVKNLPIILCTLSSFQGDFLSELENLKVTFIKKPVLSLELSNQIKELLKIHTHE